MTERVSNIADRLGSSHSLLRWMPWAIAALHAGLMLLCGLWVGAWPSMPIGWSLLAVLLSSALVWLAIQVMLRSMQAQQSAVSKGAIARAAHLEQAAAARRALARVHAVRHRVPVLELRAARVQALWRAHRLMQFQPQGPSVLFF